MGRIRTVKLGETSTRFKSISNTLVVVWSQYSSRASYALRPLPSPSSPIPSQSSTVLLLSKWMLSNSSVIWLGASFAFQFKAKSLFAIIALCYIWQPPALNCVSTTVLTFHPGFIVSGKDGLFVIAVKAMLDLFIRLAFLSKETNIGLTVMRILCWIKCNSPETAVRFDSFPGAAENVCLDNYVM